MATRENLSGYSKQTRKIVRLAQRDLRKFFALLDLTQPTVVRDALLDFLPQLAATYGDIAAVAAAEWYENLRGKVAGLPPYETVLSSGVKREAIVETVRWAAGGLWGDDPVQVRRVLEGCVQAWVKYSGRDTVARNVELDPAKPRYARVPRGSRTCAWCAMLASRGFVYRTKETAGFVEGTFHNDCDCEIVPSFEAKSAHITGYDPDTLYAQYKAAQAQVDSDGGDINNQYLIVKEMRHLFPESFKKGIKPRRKIKRLSGRKNIGNKNPIGSIKYAEGLKIEQHEVNAVETLSRHGFDIEFLPISREPNVKNPDVKINGGIWEIKSPKGSSEKNTISDQFKRASKQARNFVLDLSRCGVDERIAVQQAIRRFKGQNRIQKMMIIKRDGSIERYEK